MTALARRYARAALKSPIAAVAATALATALRGLATSLIDHPALQRVLDDPTQRSHWRPLLDAVGERLQLSELALRLVQVLAENRRLQLLPAVAVAAEALGDEAAGRLRAQVDSATPLTSAQLNHMSAALARRLGKPVMLEVRVVPELLGGLICRVGDWTFDTSLARQLEQFATAPQRT